MHAVTTRSVVLRAFWLVLLGGAAGSALATPTRGTQLNNYCALQPVQSAAPQQSRPYQAAGSTCTFCHTSGSPSLSDLNARAVAVSSCSGSGTATVCGAAVNPYCVATAPAGASITAPPVGTSVASGQSVTFTAANATNPDGFALAYNWIFSNGQANAIGQSVAVAMSGTGTVTTTLQVRNSVGMLASGVTPTRTITVTGGTGNLAPVATIVAPAANVSIAAGGTVSFQGSGTDPDNNLPLTYSWVFTGGTPASSTAQNPGAVTYSNGGSYNASLTVIDSLGMASTAVMRTVTVTGGTGNQAPVATISAPAANVSVAVGGAVTFQGSGTDPDNNLPLTYRWVFAGGTPASSTAQNPGAVTYSAAGTFTASFTVVDSLGLASPAVTRTVTVAAASLTPIASIDAPAINVSVLPGGTVTFRGSGVSATNQPLSYRWTFSGGSPSSSSSQNPGSVRFSRVGSFTVTLVVTDSTGRRSAAVTRVITVAAGNQPAPSATQCDRHTDPEHD